MSKYLLNTLAKIKFCQSLVFKANQRTLILSAVCLTKCPPRNRRSVELRWRRKTNLRHFFPLTRSWHNIIPCDSCGTYHRKWLLCPTCYDQTRYETEMVRKMLREQGEDLSEEAVLRYKNDLENDVKTSPGRIISVKHRDRPAGWFNENLWKKL